MLADWIVTEEAADLTAPSSAGHYFESFAVAELTDAAGWTVHLASTGEPAAEAVVAAAAVAQRAVVELADDVFVAGHSAVVAAAEFVAAVAAEFVAQVAAFVGFEAAGAAFVAAAFVVAAFVAVTVAQFVAAVAYVEAPFAAVVATAEAEHCLAGECAAFVAGEWVRTGVVQVAEVAGEAAISAMEQAVVA